MIYTATPISKTRLRTDHNTFAKLVNTITGALSTDTATPSFNAGVVLKGDDVWIAPADGVEVKKGDKWMHVFEADGKRLITLGWTAIIHKGVPICNNFREVTVEPPPVEPPERYTFPESFKLTQPDGQTAEYIFVKIVE